MAEHVSRDSRLREYFESLADLDPQEWRAQLDRFSIDRVMRERLVRMLAMDCIDRIPEAQRKDWLAALARETGIGEPAVRSDVVRGESAAGKARIDEGPA